MDKFENWKELCRACKRQEVGTDHVIISDLYVLGDTMDEFYENINLFFESGGRDIQCTNGLFIQMYSPRVIVKK